MLDFFGPRSSNCAGTNRRGFLKTAALSLGGLSLADLFRQRALGAETRRDTAVIQIFLSGGPSQLDTFDPKPDAPAEYRGPYDSIPTRLPGVRVCELFPQVASLMDRLTILRSVHHNDGSHHHSYHWMLTGYYPANLQFSVNERPSTGSLTARFRGANRPGLPPYVTIPGSPGYGNAGYLGVGYNPFPVDDPNLPNFSVRNLQPAQGVDGRLLADRQALLRTFDGMRRDLDTHSTAAGMDAFTRDAFDLVTGPAARTAFDMNNETPRLRDRYGRNRLGQCCLLARRLVEAGVTFVTVEDYEFTEWDLHGGPGGGMPVKEGTDIKAPNLDRALSALVSDLSDRGLLDRVLVLVMGEFGRTPLVNQHGGRDHWGNVFSVLMAGGGLRHGQVIGASTQRGERPRDRPLRPEDVLATMYHVLGIDPSQSVNDRTGRPVTLLPGGAPLREMI